MLLIVNLFIIMELKLFFMLWLIISNGNLADSKFSTENLSRYLSDTKVELARSFFKRELLKKGPAKLVSVTHKSVVELNVTNLGENGWIFRNDDENFVYTGKDVLQIRKSETPHNRYSLISAEDVRPDEGAVFFKNADWKDKRFLVICYQSGYCEIRVTRFSPKVNLKLRIDTGAIPLDVNFYGTDKDFLLIFVLDPVTIYRWTGTYFNEYYRLYTTGAQGVAIFQDGEKTVFVVAQNLGRHKVYSRVYVRKDDKIELLQLLPTNQALRILPFDLQHGEDVLHFVFVLNNVQSSSIYWWTGQEIVLWQTLQNVVGHRIIYVEKIGSEVFFFISDQNKVYVYHPTVTSFDLMRVMTFDQEVMGIDVRQEKDQLPMLVLLTGSPLDAYFKVNLILLQVNYVADSESETDSSNNILGCLRRVEEQLEERERRLKEVSDKVLAGSLSDDEDMVYNITAGNLEVVSVEESIMEMMKKAKDIEGRLKKVQEEWNGRRDGRYHVHGDLKIGRMIANRIDVEKLNGKVWNLGDLMSITKNQTLEGEVRLKSLCADQLTVPSISGIAVEDILVRKNKDVQKVSGDFVLSSLSAKNIVFGPSATLNGIPFSEIVDPYNSESVITGRKIFRQLEANQIEVETINDVPAEEWLAEVLPTLKDPTEEEPLNFTSLRVEKLWISNLNGIPWDDFLDSVYIPIHNETIKGNITVTGTTTAQNIKANKINGISVDEFFGTTARQNILCERKEQKKTLKSLPFEASPNWDVPILKEILNEPGSPYENDVHYFTGSQVVEGDLRASHVFVRNPVELSGSRVDLNDFRNRFWLKSHDQEITVPVEFTNGFRTKRLVVERINNNSLDSYFWTDEPNAVISEIEFEEVSVRGNVTLGENATQNVDLKTLNETSAKTTGENLISGRKEFLGNVLVENLKVDVLNDVDVRDLDDFMGMILKNSDNVEVSELVVDGDLNVHNDVHVEKVNDVDFTETVSKAWTWDDPNLFEKGHFRTLTVDNLEVKRINGMKAEDKLPILSKTSLKDEELHVVVNGSLELDQLNVTTINGVKFEKFVNQLVRKNETQRIRGEKIFKKMVTVKGNFKGTINDFNITELERTALSKTKPQVITGVYTVEELQANDVEVDVIDGVPADEILYQDEISTQVIHSDLVFKNNMVVGEDITADDFMNGCDLNDVLQIDLQNIEELDTLDVRGDVSWETSREEIGSLSHFLTNVVTRTRDQNITGSIVFENDVTIGKVEGRRYFNDIDLGFIAEDAILLSVPEQEITTALTFKGVVKAVSIQILDNVLVDSINGIDITDFDEKLVRKSADVVVRGKKVFKSGLTANHFDVEFINGAKTNQIVFYDDVTSGEEIRFPSVTFKKLNIFNDLKVVRVNGHMLNDILHQRLSKSADQVVKGRVRVLGNVTIKGDANIARINDVDTEDLILADGEPSVRVITGNIEFRDRISIADKLEVDYINGRNVSDLFAKALMIDDEDAVVERDVEFLSDVTIDGSIHVNETVNGCDLNKVVGTDLAEGWPKTNEEMRASLREELESLSNLTASMNKPIVFMYLEEERSVDLMMPTIHASSAHKHGEETLEFNIYGMDHGDCGLPMECFCPTQTNLRLESMEPKSIEVEGNSTRFFKFLEETLGVEVQVTTTTVSYSARCKRRDGRIDEESSWISWKKQKDGAEGFELHETMISKGFLSDVKFFRLDFSIYIVTAFYFDSAKNQTNNLDTVVYELDVMKGKLEKVDEIPSSGAQVLDVFWTTKGVILVIGNSFDSDRFTDSVDSGIYRFNEAENRFELLRFIKTHGILSIKSMRHKKDSFIFFVQKHAWPLLIVKYNHDYDNYYFSQKLDTTQSVIKSNFLSVSVISTEVPGYSGNSFVGIVLSDDSFRLFKYKHIEGFVEESYQEQNNVRVLQPFFIGSTQYILAGSGSDSSKIYRVVEQGL